MKSLFILLTLTISLFASLSPGQPFPATMLEDQFEKNYSVTAEDRIVMISFERSVSSAANDFLSQQPKGFLADHHAKYITDISAMPAIISTLFALPKMCDYPYPVMLNDDEAFKKRFEKKEEKLTVYRLKDGKIVSVDFIDANRLETLFKL